MLLLSHWRTEWAQCKDCVLLFHTHSESGTTLHFRGTGVCVPPPIECLFNCYIQLLAWSKAAFMPLSTWPTVSLILLYIFRSIIAISHFISFTILRLSVSLYWFTACDFPPFIYALKYSMAFYFKGFAKHSKESARNLELLSRRLTPVSHTGQHSLPKNEQTSLTLEAV